MLISSTVRNALGVFLAPVYPAGLGSVSLRRIKANSCSPHYLDDMECQGQMALAQSLHLLNKSEHLQLVLSAFVSCPVFPPLALGGHHDFTTRYHQINDLSTRPHSGGHSLLSLLWLRMFYGLDSPTRIYWAPTVGHALFCVSGNRSRIRPGP